MSALETRFCCPACGHETHRRRYLMAVDPDALPILSWPWALVLLVSLLVVCLAAANA